MAAWRWSGYVGERVGYVLGCVCRGRGVKDERDGERDGEEVRARAARSCAALKP